ncbi:MAG: hypothetical protein ACOYT4_00410 [Nanoarchaeota archaeon]
MKNHFLLSIGLLIFLLGFVSAQLYQNYRETEYNFNIKKVSSSEQEIIDNCKDKEIISASYCLKDNVKTFYKYKKTWDSNSLNFSELKENGGDCKNYAELYEKLGTQLGFNAEISKIKIDYTKAHAFTVLSNEDAYCVIDMLDVKCTEFAH